MTDQISDPDRNHVPKWAFGFGVFFIAVVGLLAVSHTHAFKLATTHQPERFTELYFTSPNTIPASAAPGSSIPVDFTIHNEQAADVTYTYQITFTDPAGTTTLSTRTVALKSDQHQAVSANIVVPPGSSRGEVTVHLVHMSQTIHFWLGRS